MDESLLSGDGLRACIPFGAVFRVRLMLVVIADSELFTARVQKILEVS